MIDATGLLLVPGYIDLQLNGAFGRDFTADPTTIWPVSARLPRFGVTSYLPTVITSPLETIEQARRELLDGRPAGYRGAEPLGLHVEGPFLNPQKKGAHNPAYIRAPDETAVPAGRPQRRAPRHPGPGTPGATAMIEELASRGVVVSAGHSMATYDEALAGFAAGVRYGTHLFNAMPALGHRDARPARRPARTSPGVVAGLIPDGIHVHPAVVQIIWAAQRAGRHQPGQRRHGRPGHAARRVLAQRI